MPGRPTPGSTWWPRSMTAASGRFRRRHMTPTTRLRSPTLTPFSASQVAPASPIDSWWPLPIGSARRRGEPLMTSGASRLPAPLPTRTRPGPVALLAGRASSPAPGSQEALPPRPGSDPSDGEGFRSLQSRSNDHGLRDREDADRTLDRERLEPSARWSSALAFAAGPNLAGVERERHGALRLPRRLLRRDGAGEDVRRPHLRAGPSSDDRARPDCRLPTASAPEGRVRHVSVLAPDCRRLPGRIPSFDLAIADEAHRCAGRVRASSRRSSTRDQIQRGDGCS